MAHRLYTVDGGQLSLQVIVAVESLLDSLYARTLFESASISNDSVSASQLRSLSLLIAQSYYYLYRFPLSTPSLTTHSIGLVVRGDSDIVRLTRLIQRCEALGVCSRLEVRAALAMVAGHATVAARVDSPALQVLGNYYGGYSDPSVEGATALLTVLLGTSGNSSSNVGDAEADFQDMLKGLYFDLFLYGGFGDANTLADADPAATAEHEKLFFYIANASSLLQ